MRVTPETKAQTRERILSRARKILSKKGFDAVTTRDFAAAAEIGVGTFFNYFPTKESLLITLIVQALDDAEADFHSQRRGRESLVEELFLFINTGLQRLRPYRSHLAAAMELLASPFPLPAAADVRARHLDQIGAIFQRHGMRSCASFVTLHLCWTLYLGVLSYWVGDQSPHQEDTLVLLDRSLQLLVASLAPANPNPEEPHDPER